MDNKRMQEICIEIGVERKIDRLDRKFMAGDIQQEDYDRAMVEIDEWAKEEYSKIKEMRHGA